MESRFSPERIFVSINKTHMDINTKQLNHCRIWHPVGVVMRPRKTWHDLLLDLLFQIRVTHTVIMWLSAGASCWPGIISARTPDFSSISRSAAGPARPMDVASTVQKPGSANCPISKKKSPMQRIDLKAFAEEMPGPVEERTGEIFPYPNDWLIERRAFAE